MNRRQPNTFGDAAPLEQDSDELLSAAEALIQSTLYGFQEPPQRQLDRLAGVDPTSLDRHAAGRRAVVLAARGICLARMDDSVEAVAAAEFIGKLGVEDVGLSDVERLACFSSAVEIFVLSGDAVNALDWALRLESEAFDATDARWRYRAQAALSAAYALHGMHDKARACLASMREVRDSAGWGPSMDDFLSLAAEAVLVFSSLSRTEARDLALRVRSSIDQRPSVRALADLLDAVSAMLEADLHTAAAFASCAAQGVSQPRGSALVRRFAVLLSAVIQLLLREPVRALVHLERIEPLPQHAICPGGLRAAALLHQGNYIAALAATSECARICGTHNFWTLPLSLLARAMAYAGLDQREAAVQSAADALAHARLNNLAAGLRMFPPQCVREIFALLMEDMPAFHDDVSRYRQLLDADELRDVPVPQHFMALSTLSKRERLIAAHLVGDETLREIAQQLHVATGTVKAQSSSIYRKLGVRKRADAVVLLESLSFLSKIDGIPRR